MYRRVGSGAAFIAVLVGLCIWSLTSQSIPLGIDLQGGTELIYRVVPRPGQAERGNAEAVRDTLNLRLDTYGLKELSVSVFGHDKLLVEVPGAGSEVAAIKKVIETGGALMFHLVADGKYQDAANIAKYKREWDEYEQKLAKGEPAKPPERIVKFEYQKDPLTHALLRGPDGKLLLTDDGEMVLENGEAFKVDGRLLKWAGPTTDANGLPAVGFEFNNVGAGAFGRLTEENIDKRLAIVLDDQIISAPNINSPIYGNGIIEGSFSEQEVRQVVTVLKAGSLPADLRLETEQTIGSVLGEEAILRGMQAILVGLALVVGFMAVYYTALGIVADIALLINTVLVLAAIMYFRNTLTLPGIAGLLLTVGMAVDANILIYVRIREERARGRSLNLAVVNGFSRAFETIFDSNLTTLVTAFVLFAFGSGPIKGFAVILSIGIICSFFTAIYVTRLLISILLKFELVRDFRMMKFFEKPNFDFLGKRNACITISLIAIVLGLGVLAVRGKSALGIDFTGGERLLVALNEPQQEAAIRERLDGMKRPDGGRLFDDLQVQPVGETADRRASAFAVRTRVVEGEVALAPEVSEVLRDWLAPEPFAAPELLEGRFRILLRATKDAAVDPARIQSLLAAAEPPLPAIAVEEAPGEPGLGTLFAAWRLSGELGAERLEDLARRVRAAFEDQKSVRLSTPFPEILTIGPKVARDLQGKVFVALLMAFGGIMFYCALRFELKFGFAAVVALIHDVLIGIGSLAVGDLLFGQFLDLKLNLPVVAALLTLIGYSLNDTIVIFDRVRENLAGTKRDVDYVRVVNDSVKQTLSRTVLTASTVFLVTAVLLIWAGPSLHAFSWVLTVGVVTGTYSTVYIATPALIYFNARQQRRRAALLELAAGKEPVG